VVPETGTRDRGVPETGYQRQVEYVAGVRYLPDDVRGEPFYEPTDRGNEKTIKERLAWLKQRGGGG
jgi:replication-associated recombination protein RarA